MSRRIIGTWPWPRNKPRPGRAKAREPAPRPLSPPRPAGSSPWSHLRLRLRGGLGTGFAGRGLGRFCRRCLGQRLRMVGLGIEIADDVGAVLRVGQAGEGHLGAGGKGLRAGQPFIELGEIPIAALALERVGEGEAIGALTDRLADHAPQVGPEAIRATLFGGMAGLALLEGLLAFAGVGLGHVERERLFRWRCIFAGRRFDALDDIAHLFRPLLMVDFPGHDRRTERDD